MLPRTHIVKINILTKKTASPPPGSHVIQLTGTIFELNSHIKETKFNALTKFHENWVKNVTSRVFTCFHYIHIEKNAPSTGSHVFSPIWTIFELVWDINKTNVLTNFHDDWTKMKTAPPLWQPCYSTDRNHFQLNSHIKETNVLTKFHENWAKNVTSRVFTNCFHYIHIEKNAPPTQAAMKTAPPTGGHVFQRTGTTFELNQHIIKTNILTNFELDRDFIGTKLLSKFHEDQTINVASRVFTNKCGRTDDGQRLVTKAHMSNQMS
ncbi:hypothetical protein DPMN_043636 [Dreissena polymorpha]|uniref:Uncharacterized protein n=1 Tax=Dreissena polymorpha TaxID=45954 RepID=A0A9D4D332_DREPO|nr:hypothetical protein DPMN_043636 [Dreissena polymorpha]